MRPERTFVGWARGRDRHGDETGIWHACVSEASKTSPDVQVAFAACSRQQRIAGQVEPLPEGARVCDRIGCDNWRRKLGVRSGHG